MSMEMAMSTQEQQLCQFLADLPAHFGYHYSEEAAQELLRSLFWSLAGGNENYMRLLFPDGKLNKSLKLSDAQGAVEGAEYTEAARGKRCGHIFKPGEAFYMCRTCGTDEACCLCSRCFDSTDHAGHILRIQISVGNSGCCDCGDAEAWNKPLFCTIHSDMQTGPEKGKGREADALPDDLVKSLRMTIGRVFDYLCDVISCSPEQLRQPKTKETILKDEEQSRLLCKYYGPTTEPCTEFALILWNDEKHTIQEVQDQVARACQKTRSMATRDAWEVNDIGRSILSCNSNIDALLGMAGILEAIRVTVTIRSTRDTFREQMCGTLVEWLGDISGCSVGHDNHILRRLVCDESMKPWRQGSTASQTSGLIDDQDEDDQAQESQTRLHGVRFIMALQAAAGAGGELEFDIDAQGNQNENGDEGGEGDGEGGDEDEDVEMGDDDEDNHSPTSSVAGGDEEDEDEDVMMVDARGDVGDLGMNWSQSGQALEEDEATMAGYPPPPPPPATAQAPPTVAAPRQRDGTPSDSDAAEPLIIPAMYPKANIDVPKTPGKTEKAAPQPARYWIETPQMYTQRDNVPSAEDVFQRVRLDWLLLFDLRMWKKARNDLRSLYISTVVSIPEFKRVLALRFASLYTILAQLYLVGDREPDHSIINLSLQMLTTSSITAEVVERGNFLSSLLAILYTFLTTRQVGHPWDVSPDAVLAFESGSVTNRRMYHFYQDLKYLFSSPHVQERVRSEPRYLMQFLDLVKLHQCIGPNVRAVVEHVEYEADSWITASLVTRQINLQARFLAEAFRDCPPDEIHYLQRAIRFAAKTAITYSIGAECHRFKHAEVKQEIAFGSLSDFEFEGGNVSFKVVKFVVEKDAISFHHALHYTLSWLIECGRSLPASSIRTLMSFTAQELRSNPRLMGRPQIPRNDYSAEDYLMAVFDFPLRVCAWLAQIKANMWVRNGISLRHQASTYRGVGQRDVSHHRDIFLLQTALVVCNPSRVLASIVDRFGQSGWVKGLFELKSEAQDDAQHLDVVEDMIHLLIILLSDRTSLIAPEDEPNYRKLAMRRDITHVLCFKPLSFSEICNKLPERYQEQEDFHRVLEELATFKPPEGVSDVGTFELRPEFIEEIDPYIAHYSKNQREESELAYRKKMAKKTGKSVEEIVYEPKLRPIPSGLFENLGQMTGTGMFSQIVFYSLLYPLVAEKFTPSVPLTRLETFLQVVLHLILIGIVVDESHEQDSSEANASKSFVHLALTSLARGNFLAEAKDSRTIVSLLIMLSAKEEFKSARPKIALVLSRLQQKRPRTFEGSMHDLGLAVDRVDTATSANTSAQEERELRKKAALTRQAKVMAQFQQQQKSFLETQGGMNWGSDMDEDDEDMDDESADRKHNWKYPQGTCILCQEEADEKRLYGTFALLSESRILRQTDFQDPDLVREASQTPCSLDRSADDIRPFGIAHENRKMVEKLNAKGETFLDERQTLGRGFKANCSRPGPVASSCGHMMHFSCFTTYCEATRRRHTHQIARHHPEETRRNEFVCPLCKALGNAFLPIIWKGLEESYPGHLQPQSSLEEFLTRQMQPKCGGPRRKGRESDDPGLPLLVTPSLPGSLLDSLLTDPPDLDSDEEWDREEGEENAGAEGAAGAGAEDAAAAGAEDTAAAGAEDAAAVGAEDAAGADDTVGANDAAGAAGADDTAGADDAAGAEGTAGAEDAAGAEADASQPSAAEKLARTRILYDLLTAYRRLRDTLRLNGLHTGHPLDPNLSGGDDLCSSDTLIQAVGFTIASVEIQQRGVETLPGKTLLAKIPDQVLMHLRILCETVSSYISLGARFSDPSENTMTAEFRSDSERQHCQLFIARYLEAYFASLPYNRRPLRPLDVYPPLLSQDAFSFLVECTYGLVHEQKADIAHILRLCYLAEIVKIVYHMGRNMPLGMWIDGLAARQTQNPAMANFAQLALGITQTAMEFEAANATQVPDQYPEHKGFQQPGVDTLEGWYSFVTKYALTFLRKSVVFMYVRYGVKFHSHISSSSPTRSHTSTSADADELDRLTEVLRLPTFDEMCAAVTEASTTCGWPGIQTRALVTGWIKHQVMWPRGHGDLNRSALVSHPGIFELIGLPKTYDSLIEETTRRKCPTTGQDLTDPVICLFCGDILCSQSTCCQKRDVGGQDGSKIGGAQQHMRKCQQNIGVYLNVRKCSTVYLFRQSGSYAPAPYTDKYGETDPQLRHGRQLFLNQKRYDLMIRNTVLNHGVPSVISRKLESEINNGGWDTL
ncbi:hypothetical protein E4U39_001963 [Claviceps sp. Clav50 group G5]|nr:hypothetical protein E4U39_001963 [Claviceps sp. Clav50 group G5]